MNAAALEYRHSYVSPPVSHNSSLTIAQKQAAYTDLLRHEQFERPLLRTLPERPPPVSKAFVYDRSLPTNIPDHPTAIQVNGLRQSATTLSHWSGYVAGVNSYNEGVLCGSWAEARMNPGLEPRSSMIPSANARNWATTTQQASKWLGDFHSAAEPSLAAANMYETTQQAAGKDVTDPKPPRDFFHKKGFDLDAYRREWTVANEASRARMASTENREQFKPYPKASQTTGYPKVRAQARPPDLLSQPHAIRAACRSYARACIAPSRPLAQNRAGHSGLWH